MATTVEGMSLHRSDFKGVTEKREQERDTRLMRCVEKGMLLLKKIRMFHVKHPDLHQKDLVVLYFARKQECDDEAHDRLELDKSKSDNHWGENLVRRSWVACDTRESSISSTTLTQCTTEGG